NNPGSSEARKGGGVFWHYALCNRIGQNIGVLLLIALGVALRLARLKPLGAKV
ncbi:MFS transporter, partial [Pseudomonas syringae pv. tagetis]